MELKIEHLAPYLPYGLNLQYIVRGKVEKIGVMKSISHNEDETHPTRVSITQMYNQEHIWMFRPLLKPKTHLHKLQNEILIRWGGGLSERGKAQWIKIMTDSMLSSAHASLIHDEVQFMLENHIDVFGLIDNDLATAVS